MVCPHKKIIVKTVSKLEDKIVERVTFGECDRSQCPYFILLTTSCTLLRGVSDEQNFK